MAAGAGAAKAPLRLEMTGFLNHCLNNPKSVQIIADFCFGQVFPKGQELYRAAIRGHILQAVGRYLCTDVVQLITLYCISHVTPIGQEFWLNGLNANVSPQPPLSQDFYHFWNGPDPHDPAQFVSDTHLPPIYAPHTITNPHRNITAARCLRTLRGLGLAFSGLQGHGLNDPSATMGGSSCWLVLRKAVLARNQTFPQQKEAIAALNAAGASYEPVPAIVDLATAVFVYQRFSGLRFLGDPTGSENQATYSRVKEGRTISVGYFDARRVLCLFPQADNSTANFLGIAALAKF